MTSRQLQRREYESETVQQRMKQILELPLASIPLMDVGQRNKFKFYLFSINSNILTYNFYFSSIT